MKVTLDTSIKPEDLTWEEFIIVQLLEETGYSTLASIKLNYFNSLRSALYSLQSKEYIKIMEDIPEELPAGFIPNVEWRLKGSKLFKTFLTSEQFDQFWNLFPEKTEDGRVLRAEGKEFRGKPTKDYIEAKKKYFAVVKDVATHEEILKILTARIRQPLKYMNNIITYINQRMWEKDGIYLRANTDSMHEML